jgi:hypothetical protein
VTNPNPLGAMTLATATAAKSGSTVTAVVAGRAITIQVARDLTVASGDVLIVAKTGAGARSQWFAVGRAFAAAPGYVDPDGGIAPPPAFATPSGRLAIAPTFTGTYRDGAWVTGSNDVQQGIYGGAGNATGVAYYGVKAQALAGATVLAAAVHVARLTGGPTSTQTATLQLVTQTDYDGSAPTLTASTAGPALAPGGETDFAVPTAWAQAMVDGTAGGLALLDGDGVPYMRFGGRGGSAAAWLLSIDWTR